MGVVRGPRMVTICTLLKVSPDIGSDNHVVSADYPVLTTIPAMRGKLHPGMTPITIERGSPLAVVKDI